MGIEAGSSTYYQAKRGTVQNGLLLHLDAGVKDSADSSTWYDLSGNGNHITLLNGAAQNKDNGGAINFDGTDDIGRRTSSFLIDPNSFTISSFYKTTTSTPSRQPIFAMHFYAGFWNIIWIGPSYNAEYIEAAVAYNYPAGSTETINKQTYILGAWKHSNAIHEVSMTYSYSSKTLDLYFNGNLINTGTNSNMPQLGTITSNNLFQIGQYTGTTGILFRGNMYNLLIYNRKLSSDEITQNYNATRHRFGV